MKKMKPEVEQHVYAVQDYEQHLVGIYSTLAKAFERYKNVLTHSLSEQDRQLLIDEFGEDFHDEIDYPPCIIVYQMDGVHLESYDSIYDIKRALEEGEDYS